MEEPTEKSSSKDASMQPPSPKNKKIVNVENLPVLSSGGFLQQQKHKNENLSKQKENEKPTTPEKVS